MNGQKKKPILQVAIGIGLIFGTVFVLLKLSVVPESIKSIVQLGVWVFGIFFLLMLVIALLGHSTLKREDDFYEKHKHVSRLYLANAEKAGIVISPAALFTHVDGEKSIGGVHDGNYILIPTDYADETTGMNKAPTMLTLSKNYASLYTENPMYKGISDEVVLDFIFILPEKNYLMEYNPITGKFFLTMVGDFSRRMNE